MNKKSIFRRWFIVCSKANTVPVKGLDEDQATHRCGFRLPFPKLRTLEKFTTLTRV